MPITLSLRLQPARRASLQNALARRGGRLALILFLVALAFAQPAAMAVAEPHPLVDVAWIEANAERPEVRLLDIRNGIGGGSAAVFAKGHIPGSVYSDYLKDGWRTKRDGIPGQLPSLPALEALIGGLGIDNGSHVVIIAAGASALETGSATRIYWTFKVLGHDALSILDGGYRAYTADPANPVATGPSAPEPAIFTAKFRPELIADRNDVVAAIAAGQTLVDNRPMSQFLGQRSHPAASRPGTIRGAVSVPENQLTDSDGRFVNRERLATLLKSAGVGLENQATITFCNTGHWASLGWFVQSEILGRKNVRLYDGSLVDWTAQANLPVETQVGSDQ